MENIREIRQQEAVNAFLSTRDFRGITLVAPRVGKCRIGFKIIRELNPKSILILYPNIDIKKGWEDEARLLNFNIDNITFFTFASIKKLNAKFDFIIIDEIHKLSKNNIENLQFNYLKCPTLGLTGTLTNKTANTIYDSLTIPVCYKYSINKAVEESILTPYKIYIHKVPLDDKKWYLKQYKYSRYLYTEKELFTILQKSIADGEDIIKNIKTDQKLISKITKDNFFMYLKSINIIQNSIAKISETKRLLDIFSKDRVLVFCGTTNTTDQLDIPVYHSKAKEKKVFEDFAEGRTQYLATIDMLKAGKFLCSL